MASKQVYYKFLAARFWSKVNKSQSPNDCWMWQAATHDWGYGIIRINGRNERAHRVAWELTNGHIPTDMFVCHKCDNPSCVNPSHLFLGTNADNMHDMASKGRHFSVLKSQLLPRGEEHWKAKLSESDVSTIREEYSKGDISQTALAKRFGVSQEQISNVVTRHSWRDF